MGRAERKDVRHGFGLGDAASALCILLALALGAFLLRPEALTGPVRVVDGDTLVLDGHRIRLSGIDAPEIAQSCERNGAAYRCGEAAASALRELVAGGPVACRLSGRDRYDRALGRCSAGGQDLGAALVRSGLAVAYGGYAAEESEARARRAGLWAGTFQRPSEWRRGHEAGR